METEEALTAPRVCACAWRIPKFLSNSRFRGVGRIVLCAIFGRSSWHLLATVARLAVPGGVRAVVAESVLVKHQLLILNRSRKRSPNLRPADRVVAGLCAVFMRPGRLIRSAIIFKPSSLLNLHRVLIQRKYRRLLSSNRPKNPGPKGPQPGRHRRCRRDEAAEPKLGVSTDRAADRTGLRYFHRQGCGATDSGGSATAETMFRGAILADRPRSREGQSVEC